MKEFLILALTFLANGQMSITYFVPEGMGGRLTVQTQCDWQGYWDNWVNFVEVPGTNTVIIGRPRCAVLLLRLQMEVYSQ